MQTRTRRQHEVLDFIARHMESHGYRPSYQVIARHLGLRSRAGIGRIVHDLESQGLLARRREDGHFYIDVGKNAGAGAQEIFIEWLDIPHDDNAREEWQMVPFALPRFLLDGYDAVSVRAFRVPDDALESVGICEDDIALIELRDFTRDGQTVAAVINQDRAVLRKYFRAGADIELRPADETGEIIRIAANRVEIKGVFRGLLRPMG